MAQALEVLARLGIAELLSVGLRSAAEHAHGRFGLRLPLASRSGAATLRQPRTLAQGACTGDNAGSMGEC
jgi:hypothetical protein